MSPEFLLLAIFLLPKLKHTTPTTQMIAIREGVITPTTIATMSVSSLSSLAWFIRSVGDGDGAKVGSTVDTPTIIPNVMCVCEL